MTGDLVVSVIDDDESVRESISALLHTYGFDARAFDAAESFLASDGIDGTRCIVLDVAMPGMSGPELFETLKLRPTRIPVIFITARDHGDVCRRLLASGAVACFHKPFEPKALIQALERALTWNSGDDRDQRRCAHD